MAGYTRKFVRGAGVIFIVGLLTALINYLIRLVLAKNLSVEDYGLFYAVLTVIMFVVLFEKLGLGEALAKFISEFRVKKRYSLVKNSIISVSVIQLIMACLFAFLLIISSNFLALNYFHSPQASLIIKIFAIFVVLRPVSAVCAAVFQGFQKMKHLASVDLVRAFFILAISFIGFKLGKGVLVPAIAYLLTALLLAIIFIPFVFNIFPEFLKEKFVPNKKLTKKLLKFGVIVLIGSTCTVILGYIDTVMLTFFSGLKQVGLYNVALPTAKLLGMFGIAVAAVILPFAAELWAKRSNEILKQGIELIHRYSFIVMLPFALVIFSFPKLIINSFFGADYIQAASALRILSVGVIFFAVAIINGDALLGIGKPQIFTRVILKVALFNILFNLLLIPPYGTIGAAIATSSSYLLMFCLTLFQLKKFILIKIPLLSWLKNLFIAFVFVLAVCLLKGILEMSVLLEAVLIVFISLFVYVLLVLLLKLTTIEEVKAITKRVL